MLNLLGLLCSLELHFEPFSIDEIQLKNGGLQQTIKAGCDESKLVKKTSPPNNSMEKPAMA
ncbi:MAG: hypothetical protein Q8844_02765 [Pigeon pea little leaf phytoplasma]|nr:hypothetical protein [Pigeon pea little leaf phytoplasma]